MKRQIICLLNAIVDQPLQDLGGLTPLEKACHLSLDQLAREGSSFLVEPPGKGGLETALLALFGIREGLESVAAGPLELMGLGYFLSPHQRAFSCRFVSSSAGVVVDVGDHLLSDNEGKLLCQALNQTLGSRGFHFLPVQGSHAVLITSNSSVDGGPKPVPAEVVGRHWKELMPACTCEFLERVTEILSAHEVNALKAELEELPVNAIWLSGGGAKPAWSPRAELGGRLYTESLTSAGAAKSVGARLWRLPKASQRFGEIPALLEGLEEQLTLCPRVIVDLHYLWRSTYGGALLEKIKTIEWLDLHLMKPLLSLCQRRQAELVVTTLRAGDIRSGTVAPGSVPVTIWPADGIRLKRFDESAFATLTQAPIPLQDLLSPVES